jgi:hypothetical protein
MTPTHFFTHGHIFTGGWDDYFLLFVLLYMSVLGVLLYLERSKHEPDRHSPRMAWIRAGLYFGFALVFSWATGVFQTVVTSPLATPEQTADPVWWAVTILCFAVVVWSYVYWWPRGTLTHGRKLYFAPTLLYGLAWGACTGFLYLSIYAVLEQFQFPKLVTAIIFVALLSVYNMNYQLGWWDIHVSPPHNIKATNAGKVALAHNPFLLTSLTYLVIYGNVGIYVILNACALGASTVAMRFPPFWADDGGKVSVDTALGE